jgi:hypothetical protein
MGKCCDRLTDLQSVGHAPFDGLASLFLSVLFAFHGLIACVVQEFVWNPRVMSVRTADEKEQPTGALGVSEERTIVYHDGTKQRVRLLELSDAQHSLSWTVVESTPAVSYSGTFFFPSLLLDWSSRAF